MQPSNQAYIVETSKSSHGIPTSIWHNSYEISFDFFITITVGNPAQFQLSDSNWLLGFLLTMSAAKGVEYLDSRLEEYLCESPDSLITNPDTSAVGHVMKLFESNGTSTPGQWHMATVEWLLVHLITEVGVTPHNFSTGRNMGAMMEAYQDILREFVCFLSYVFHAESS